MWAVRGGADRHPPPPARSCVVVIGCFGCGSRIDGGQSWVLVIPNFSLNLRQSRLDCHD